MYIHFNYERFKEVLYHVQSHILQIVGMYYKSFEASVQIVHSIDALARLAMIIR